MKYISAAHSCDDCGCCIGQDNGPPDGWQLEDGRTVCHACCVADTRPIDIYEDLYWETRDGYRRLTVEEFVKSQRKGF